MSALEHREIGRVPMGPHEPHDATLRREERAPDDAEEEERVQGVLALRRTAVNVPRP